MRGRPLCIDTAVADPALWMEKFGVDVDHVDQMALVRRAEQELANPAKVNKAFEYLKKHVKKIHYAAPDAKMKNTEELTRRAIALYYGMTSLCDEFGYDFCCSRTCAATTPTRGSGTCATRARTRPTSRARARTRWPI